jgi:integrase
MNLRLHILPHWADRDYTTIERADVISLVERIVTAGKPVMANRVQALISGIFSFAIDADLLKANPCMRLRKRGQERVKTRVLSDDELRLFWAHAPDSEVGRVLRVILMTGCRPAEAAGMAKIELEFDAAGHPTSWLIPPDRSKNGRAHFVPLSTPAAEIIGNSINESDFIFPARRAGAGAIARHSVTGAMNRMTEAFPKGAPGLSTWLKEPPTPHDLRRTVATRLAATGTSSDDVAAVLGHVRTDITGRHYDHYNRAAEKMRALHRWAQILAAILTPPEPNVVAIDRRR